MSPRPSPPPSDRTAPAVKLSPRTLLTLFALLVVYLLVRPTLSDWFGVRLPGLFPEEAVAVNDEPVGDRSPSAPADAGRRATDDDDVASQPVGTSEAPGVARTSPAAPPVLNDGPASATREQKTADPIPPAKSSTSPESTAPVRNSPNRNETPPVATRTSPSSATTDARPAPAEEPAPPKPAKPANPARPKPKLGALTDLGNKRYQSTAGLIYRQLRSEHRIEHVMRHAEDDPSRSVHGVFEGDQDRILAVIDEAYLIALTSGPPKAVSEEQDDRTVMTVDLGRKIGYMGGQAGKRRNFPPCRHLQLVVEGEEVVTAYPVIPR